MTLTDKQISDIGVSLNEATLLGIEYNKGKNIVGITFGLVTLNEKNEVPKDRRVQFVLSPVGRIIASLRLGRWDDKKAKVEKFSLENLLHVVQSFGGLPIYGWEFIDTEDNFKDWEDRVSFDYKSSDKAFEHHIDLFQEGNNRHLDIRIWFNDLKIFDANGKKINLNEFIAGGKRAWDNIYYGKDKNPFGIIPLK